ncbi:MULTISPECIES: hypothetical protein [Sporolactobacillus]|uniref:Uncharacterized protein n=2 Tax=Sporolactobacillus TaxID=2077 RepID=A0A0U1QLP5_9BACL|nr:MULTISPECIES: hypothetical protein [Sporolactobacillus]KLI01719.1 hypothetical protein SINU_11990 [Sporolactobacillus inulinus CASD]QAA23768.1 hypothetical protein C0674_14890 [Sporolactobacillus terrae]QAA26739.1 hypothetical protein C0679_14875 [Sporolactobacillus terrae]BBO00302.1 hypothetical protein St703_30060 [Sporolactobacillus terrae]GEB77694.1 hypothetical protein SIN01_20390 [Sporolactobacillus inulinus]
MKKVIDVTFSVRLVVLAVLILGAIGSAVVIKTAQQDQPKTQIMDKNGNTVDPLKQDTKNIGQ